MDNFSDFIVFVDESGDHNLEKIDPQYPIFTLCFCIFQKVVYNREATPLIRELKMGVFNHDLVILHEHDIRKRKGAFSRMDEAARSHFLDSLTDIIQKMDVTVIAVVIDKAKHKERYVNPVHPYHLAMEFGLERIFDFVTKHEHPDQRTTIVFEARGDKEDKELELEFRRVCDGANRYNRSLPFEILIADKKTNSEGLQLADLMARPVGLSVLKPEQSNRALEVIQKKLFRGKFNAQVDGNGLKIFP
jgi:hypothetical protein